MIYKFTQSFKMIFPMKKPVNATVLQKSDTYMDIKSILYLKNCFVYTDDDKPEMTMPKRIDVKVTKPQNKNGHGRTRKCPIAGI